MYRCNWNFKLCIITCDFAKFYLKFAQSQRRKGGNVSVCFSYTLISRLLDFQAFTCARGASVPGRVGDLPLGPTFKFRALCTGAVSISCSARFVEVTVQLMLRADL